jgi:hypothetical protein
VFFAAQAGVVVGNSDVSASQTPLAKECLRIVVSFSPMYFESMKRTILNAPAVAEELSDIVADDAGVGAFEANFAACGGREVSPPDGSLSIRS